MESDLAQLVSELKILRKGRGLFASKIGERVGPALREVCGVAEGDGPAQIRRKLSELIENLSFGLPEDLRMVLMAAFAIDRDVQMPNYWDRVRWAAEKICRDERTVRRRVDEGIDRIAELATIDRSANSLLPGVSAAGWHTEELRIILVLDKKVPEAFEFRRVVAEGDHVGELDLAMTLTANSERRHSPEVSELDVDVLYGGMLVKKMLESQDRFGLVLALGDELNLGQRHEFMLRYRSLYGHMQPHFVCVPKHRCDMFDLRIRFDVDQLPSRVWRLTEAFQRDVDDPTNVGESLRPDTLGEVRTMFHHLTPGRAHGIRWTAETATGVQAH